MIGMVTKGNGDFDQAKAVRKYRLVLGDGGQAQTQAFSAPLLRSYGSPGPVPSPTELSSWLVGRLSRT
jgi:hypothetical protein